MKKKPNIRLIAVCIFQNKGKILVSKGRDKKLKRDFYRVIGGGIKFSETSEVAVRREIREELKSGISNLKLFDVVEDIYTYNGNAYHDIAFLYKGNLQNRKLYLQNPIHIAEKTYKFDACWLELNDILKKNIKIYPTFNYKFLLRNN